METRVSESVPANPVGERGAEGVTVRVLIGPNQNAPTFNMRLFEVDSGGHTPLHTHAWEHEVYVLAGRGIVRTGQDDHKVSPGDCVYIRPDEKHQFVNAGSKPLKFLCIVPRDTR